MLFDLIFLKELLDRYYSYGRRMSEAVDICVTREQMQAAVLAEGFAGYDGLEKIIARKPYADKCPEIRPFFRDRT